MGTRLAQAVERKERGIVQMDAQGCERRAAVHSQQVARDRLFELGPASLSDRELLSVLVGSGVKGRPAAEIADRLLNAGGGLKSLCQRQPQELRAIAGVGPGRAAQILALFELGRRTQRALDPRPRLRTPQDIYQYLAPRLSALRREVFHVLSFNRRSVLLNDARVAEGTTDCCPVDPREVFAAAISARACGIVLAHNHPSGDPEPSLMDLALTQQLAEGGEILGVQVLDHLVVGDARFVSLYQRGKFPKSSRRQEEPPQRPAKLPDLVKIDPS
jgi:DNA repair protein RadC